MPILARLRHIPNTLAQPNYGIYVAGNSLSVIGTWMQGVGVGWLAWDLTHSGTVLGLVAFADLFPALVIGPFGGALADRWDRRRLLMAGQAVSMCLSFLLFALVFSGLVTVSLLMLIVALSGAVVGVNQPARLSLVSSLVPRDHLPTAVAINSLVFNLARFIGPAIAGLIILRFDIAVLFLLNALTFVSLLFALSRLDLSAQPKGRDGAKPPPMLRAIGEGFRYVVNHPGICPLLVLAAVSAVMVRPLSELLPGIADELFERGAGGFAALSSVVGLGAVAGGLFLAQRDTRKDLTRTAMLASLLGTISGLCLALSPTFWMALIAAGAAGLGLVMAGVATQTLIQTSVDEAVRGRALSLLGLVIRSGPALGALVMGFVSEFTGLRWPLAVGALLSMLAWTIIWRHRQRMSDAMRPIRDRGSSPARPAP